MNEKKSSFEAEILELEIKDLKEELQKQFDEPQE